MVFRVLFIVFFHELAHCAHEKVNGSLKAGQDPIQEIVAELSAQALCRIVGKTDDKYLGNSYRYIEVYAESLGIIPFSACLKAMSDTEKVLDLILKQEETIDTSLAWRSARRNWELGGVH